MGFSGGGELRVELILSNRCRRNLRHLIGGEDVRLVTLHGATNAEAQGLARDEVDVGCLAVVGELKSTVEFGKLGDGHGVPFTVKAAGSAAAGNRRAGVCAASHGRREGGV